jgi:hypothetical protein
MKKILSFLCLLLFLSTPAFAADYTTAKGVLMDWTLLDDTAGTPFLESDPLVTDTWLTTQLHITMAHADTNAAATAARAILWQKSGTTDECWEKLMEFPATTGTANLGNCDQESAAAQPNVYIAATANFQTSGDTYFLKDEGTLANSCLIVNGNFATDDYIICVDNLVNTYDADDNTYDIVDQWSPTLPPGFTFRVTFHNTDADATYAVRIHHSENTDIAD